MATANKTMNATKVVIPCRISFAAIFEPKSINGSEAKYSVSCLIPKEDKKTLLAIHKAIEAAKEDGKVRKWGGKVPPNLKMPLRDGDIDRPDDENYTSCFFLNASSKDAPQVVDRHVQPVLDPMMVYSGCYCNVSVNFYAFNANGNRGVAAGLGNIQFVKDGDKTITSLMNETAKAAGTTLDIVRYVRFERGEGIEKRKDDLAAEIAAMKKA